MLWNVVGSNFVYQGRNVGPFGLEHPSRKTAQGPDECWRCLLPETWRDAGISLPIYRIVLPMRGRNVSDNLIRFDYNEALINETLIDDTRRRTSSWYPTDP